jgi:tripartite-type tricarboxylate transporter receptor subunit TctC
LCSRRLGAATLGSSTRLLAQTWPERPITFICPWPAGGTADQSMRALCTVAGRILGQAIAVENRAGASGMIGSKAWPRPSPTATPSARSRSRSRASRSLALQADPRKDYTYIARTSGQTFGIAVPANSRFKTLQDFVAAAKAKPGSITYAHAGVGGATHVGMEEFAAAAGIQLSHVPYKGGAEALQGVLGGHVDALADSSSWAPHVEAGKLRLLATWGEQRTPRFKDTPTLKDLGYNVVVDAPNGIGAPKACRPPSKPSCAMPSARPWPAPSSSPWPTGWTRPCSTWTAPTTPSM